MLKLMENSEVDVSRTLVVCSEKSSKVAVKHLMEIALPENYCSITSCDSTSIITLNYSFESNPFTSLLCNLSPPSADNIHSLPQVQEKLISTFLPLELMFLWQFGERRPEWKVVDSSVSPPRHILVSTHEREGKNPKPVLEEPDRSHM